MSASHALRELIGWSASLILLLTMCRQVYAQWRARTVEGVSHWLFVGQLSASAGFMVYSLLLHNWVFVATNLLLLINAGLGIWIYRRKSKAR